MRRAILVGHSWGGAFATAYAFAFPDRTAGLVLLSAVTHPWAADPGWYNNLAALPGIGPLFLRTLVYPLSFFLADRASRSVFEPQGVPDDYLRRAAIPLVLRPKTFFANARDLALLKSFILAQVPRYAGLRSSTIIITGDRDTMVSPDINARALAATLPHAKLVFLRASDTCHTMPRRTQWSQQSMSWPRCDRTTRVMSVRSTFSVAYRPGFSHVSKIWHRRRGSFGKLALVPNKVIALRPR